MSDKNRPNAQFGFSEKGDDPGGQEGSNAFDSKRVPGRDTITTHAGRDPLRFDGMVNTPVYRTSTVLFKDVGSYQRRDPDNYKIMRYGIYGTPTTFAFEEAVAQLEGGYAAVALPSGLAAIVAARAGSGDRSRQNVGRQANNTNLDRGMRRGYSGRETHGAPRGLEDAACSYQGIERRDLPHQVFRGERASACCRSRAPGSWRSRHDR